MATADSKRFYERWIADPTFRDFFESARSEPETAQELTGCLDAVYRHLEQMRSESAPSTPRFRAWRERQLARCLTEFRNGNYVSHAPFAIELSRGCSVGCWFCGVSAPKLDGHFLYTASNARFFREVLEVLGEFAGPVASRWGFLYWATDPFDNPDYEQFCLAFSDVFGQFPITTTALPLKDRTRTRSFLELSRRHGSTRIRFSVLSLAILSRIHTEFSAEELDIVELVPENEGSLRAKAVAGRARERYLGQGIAPPDAKASSIACVSGFLLNLVDRSIRMITPCASDERWPLGYWVYDERRFDSAAELHDAIADMIDRHMLTSYPASRPVRFRRNLTFEDRADGFVLVAALGNETFAQDRALRDLALLIRDGERTLAELPETGAELVDRLFHGGLLDEEPQRA